MASSASTQSPYANLPADKVADLRRYVRENSGTHSMDEISAAIQGKYGVSAQQVMEPSPTDFGRSVAQGLTFSHADEIYGLWKMAQGGSYKEARDQMRGNDQAFAQAHPWINGITQAAAGGIPGLALGPLAGIQKGAHLANIGRGAAVGAGAGALQGEGASNANTVGGMAQDAAIGAGIGGAFGAGVSGIASKLAGNLPSGTQGAVEKEVASQLPTDPVAMAKNLLRQEKLAPGTVVMADASPEMRRFVRAVGADRKAQMIAVKETQKRVEALATAKRDVGSTYEQLKGLTAPMDEDLAHALTEAGHGSVVKTPTVPGALPREQSLARFAPELHHETNVDNALAFLGSVHQDMAPKSVYLSNVPELATGQGKNTGIKLVLDASKLRGAEHAVKPGSTFAAEQGASEFIARANKQSAYQDAVKSITVTAAAQAGNAGYAERLTGTLKALQQQGWTKEVLPDGSLKLTRPPQPSPVSAQEVDMGKLHELRSDLLKVARRTTDPKVHRDNIIAAGGITNWLKRQQPWIEQTDADYAFLTDRLKAAMETRKVIMNTGAAHAANRAAGVKSGSIGGALPATRQGAVGTVVHMITAPNRAARARAIAGLLLTPQRDATGVQGLVLTHKALLNAGEAPIATAANGALATSAIGPRLWNAPQ